MLYVQKAVALGNNWELEEYGFGEEDHPEPAHPDFKKHFHFLLKWRHPTLSPNWAAPRWNPIGKSGVSAILLLCYQIILLFCYPLVLLFCYHPLARSGCSSLTVRNASRQATDCKCTGREWSPTSTSTTSDITSAKVSLNDSQPI